MTINQEIFKAYDVRGLYPEQINEKAAYKIAQAYLKIFQPDGAIVLGKDVRLSSPGLWQAAAKGITNAGYDVIDIGTVSTDMLYFTVANYGYGGGITISASHNPAEYNGMKFVREKAIAVSADTGIMDIKKQALKEEEIIEPTKGQIIKKDILNDYINHCLAFIDITQIKPMKIVADANFGMAGIVLKKILEGLPIEIVELNFQPDGGFPKGRPDPKIFERRKEVGSLVKKEQVDFGVAWDADADRCFFFDEKGEHIDAYYITAILAKHYLGKQPKQKVLCDVRLVWAIEDVVNELGGQLIINKPGHAFIKDTMRKEDILFGGETSGHYYFKDNFYADNGMIPFLLILEILCLSDKKISQIADYYRKNYPNSGEINKQVKDKDAVLQKIEKEYQDGKVDHIDGVSVEYDDWRFNLRKSNTEPVIRLNLEAKTQKLVDQKTKEILQLIK
ncbi:MAG: phosphomannomutase|nr:phosphomannomutase [Candidatus Buchananbacteria bacterium]